MSKGRRANFGRETILITVGYARLGLLVLPTAQVPHWLHRLCSESQRVACHFFCVAYTVF